MSKETIKLDWEKLREELDNLEFDEGDIQDIRQAITEASKP